jgi:plastocyanin
MDSPRRLFFLGIVSLLAACGGGGDNGGTNPPPPSVTLGSIVPSVATLALGAGQTSTLSATARDANNNVISATGYTFTSSNNAVAVTSSGGQVIGLGAGTATITVSLTLNGVTKTASVAVTVTGALPTTVTVAAGANSDDFTPALAAVARNGTVTWTFGARQHNVQFSSSGAPAGIGNSANTSVSRTFPTGGVFAYTCTLHANQNGTVAVP